MSSPWVRGAYGPFQQPVEDLAASVPGYRNVYFVDGTFGSDNNPGLSVNTAFATVQQALDTVQDEDTIIVMRGSYDEALTTGQLIATANMAAGRGRYVNLIGSTQGRRPYDAPQLYNVSGSTATIRMRSPGWRVSGFRLVGDSGSPKCMTLELDQAGSTADTDWAPGTTVDNCVFYGAVGTASGIDFQGAPPDIRIVNNVFQLFGTASYPCIQCSVSSTAQPYRCEVTDNVFMDSDEYINMNPRGFNSSHILRNTFDTGHTNTVTDYVDLTGGNDNVVCFNVFPGDYSNAGGYTAGTGDTWVGNFADDTAEGEVGDNGITTANPAA